MSFDHLTDLELDAFKEIGTIGAGHGATALSQMMGRKIGMTVPDVKVLPFSQVPDELGGPEIQVAAVFTSVDGVAPCNILLMFPLDCAKILVGFLMECPAEEVVIDEMTRSALAEVGNIVAGAYLGSLATFTKLDFIHNVPAVAIDMAGAILDAILAQAGTTGDHVLLIETIFSEIKEKVSGHFFLLPAEGSLEKIMEAIGVKK